MKGIRPLRSLLFERFFLQNQKKLIHLASGGLAFVPVRHLAQGPPVLEYHLGPPLAPLVSFGAPPLLRYMYI